MPCQIRVFPGSSLGSQSSQAEGPASWGRGAQEPELSVQEPHGAPPSMKATPLLHFWAISTFKSGQRVHFYEGPGGACRVKPQEADGFGVAPA